MFMVRDSQNQLSNEKEEVLEIWKVYYQDKFNEPQNKADNILEVCLSDNSEMRQEEDKEALRSIKLGKVCGRDNLARNDKMDGRKKNNDCGRY